MAFSSTIISRTVAGDRAIAFGTFTNGTTGDTGGDIQTGLKRVDYINLQHTGTSVTSNAPVVNESFPLSGGDVTIVTDDDADGIWTAYGIE